MGSFSVECGHNKHCLRFYIPSPARSDVELPNGQLSFSREVYPEDSDWEFLSDEGRRMVESLRELQGGRKEYVLVTADYIEVTLYSDEHGLAIFVGIAEVLNQWTGGGALGIYLTESCTEEERWWLSALIHTLSY